MGARTWRVEKARRNKRGVVRVLRTGRGKDRLSLSLGVVSEAEAERARDQANLEEERGSIDRVLALHDRDKEACVAYLIGDPRARALQIEPAYATWSLRRYYEEVYRDEREAAVRGWNQERNRWNQILDGLGDRRVRDIDKWVVANWLDSLVSTRGPRAGQPLSGNAKRNLRNVLRSLLVYAHRRKHILELPDLATFRIRGSTRPVTPEEDPLDLDELMALLRAGPTPKHRAMWAVAGGNGLRPSELQRLRWDGVAWDPGLLTIPGHASGPRAGRGKTALSAGTVPMTPLVRTELRKWWERCGEPTAGIVFWGSAIGKPYSSTSGYKKALRTAAESAGITRNVTPYLLRDSFATIAWSLGIERDVTRRIMRHVDEAMLDQIYCRPRPQDLIAKVAAFDAG